jgi:Flp pilus assembly protein TadD
MGLQPATPSPAVKLIDSGNQFASRGEMDLALSDYLAAVDADPKSPDAYFFVGAAHSAKGNKTQAAQWFKKALDINPQHFRALETYGLMLLKDRQYQMAEPLLQRAAAVDGKSWRLHNGLGVICDHLRDQKCAELHYMEAIGLRPNLAIVYTNLGYSKYLHGKYDNAMVYYKKALEADPNHEKAWANLGLLHVRRQEYDEALTAFNKIMGDSEAVSTVGQICAVEKKYQRAEGFFLEAIRLAPSYSETSHKHLEKVREEMMKEDAKGTGPLQCTPNDSDDSPIIE